MIAFLLRRTFTLGILGCMLVSTCLAAEPAIIAKARSFLGGDEALDRIASLHYVGTLIVDNVEGQTPPHIKVEIMAQKPSRQRTVITSDQGVETTVLDDYEGWQKVHDPKDPTRWKMDLLGSDQIRSLRANVRENLFFFRGLAGQRGTVEDLGVVTIDGVACRKVSFVYSPQIIFYRYFDEATGRLVLTETGQGESIREEGEIIAGGVKFPRTLLTTRLRPDGSTQQVTIRFEKVSVNETFADELFAVPSLGGR
jgi:outer membrane lipoprotein-sorting protein